MTKAGTALLNLLHRLNHAYPWDHNAHYHRAISRALPARMTTALDVGCGTGDLVRLLLQRTSAVTGIDADHQMIDRARELTPAATPASYAVAEAPDALPAGPFDAITCVAVLHHLPFDRSLRAFRQRLAPGGTLVVVGCYRRATRSDALIDLVALALNPLIGWVRNRGRPAERPVAMTAPVAAADMPYDRIVRETAALLPGARIRRRLFWRYVMVWHAPAAPGQPASIVTENANRSPR